MGQSTNGKKFELVLGSENVGVWMSINNAFTFDWSDSGRSKRGRGPHQTDAYWNGVLFQFGRFWAAENDLLMDGFDTIAFLSDGVEKLILSPEDFKNDSIVWINIVKSGARQDPVRLTDFPKWIKLGEIKERDFVRPKTLHQYLEPYPGGMTLWHDDGYSIDARTVSYKSGDLPHMSHTFKFNMPDRIEVLRLARDKAPNHAAHWERPKPNGGEEAGWEPWVGGTAPETLPNLVKDLGIDRIEIRDARSSGAGGQQIGKNPPQG